MLVLLLSLPVLTACGGGGGTDVSTPANYTGASTQATITTDNSQMLVVGFWNGGMTSSQVGQATTLSVGNASSPSVLGMLQLAKLLEAPVVQTHPGSSSVAKPASVSSNTIAGNCGGSADYTLTLNDTTGSFSGTFTFNDFCSDGTTISSGMTVSGKSDPGTGTISQLNMSFSSLNITDGSQSVTIVGSINTNIASDGSGGTASMDFVVENPTTQENYWVHNFQISYVDSGTSEQETVSGQFFAPDSGYLAISTTTPLIYPSTATVPTQGTLLFRGKNNTAAELTFNSTGNILGVDANGDGVYEQTISDLPLN